MFVLVWQIFDGKIVLKLFWCFVLFVVLTIDIMCLPMVNVGSTFYSIQQFYVFFLWSLPIYIQVYAY